MQIFIIMALGVFLSYFGVSEFQKYSSTSKQDNISNMSDSYASNVYIYNDLAVQYLLQPDNYLKNFNPDAVFTNYINYSTSNNFNISNLQNYYQSSYNYVQRYNYNSTFFLYSEPSTAGTNNIPLMYLITTWDAPDFDTVNMFASFNRLLSAKKQSGDNTYWVNGVYGSYIGNQVTLYSLLPQQVAPSTITDILQNKVFLQLKTQGFTFNKYFYITPIYSNN